MSVKIYLVTYFIFVNQQIFDATTDSQPRFFHC